MSHNAIETAVGAIVLAAAAVFMVFAMKTVDVSSNDGYPVKAAFINANGLNTGSDVRIGGVKVGSVADISLDPVSFEAVVTLNIKEDVKLPTDTSATIRSESLMGGKFMALEPGGDEKNLAAGERIEHTQSVPDLEQMLGQAIFSMSQAKDTPSSQPATAQP